MLTEALRVSVSQAACTKPPTTRRMSFVPATTIEAQSVQGPRPRDGNNPQGRLTIAGHAPAGFSLTFRLLDLPPVKSKNRYRPFTDARAPQTANADHEVDLWHAT